MFSRWVLSLFSGSRATILDLRSVWNDHDDLLCCVFVLDPDSMDIRHEEYLLYHKSEFNPTYPRDHLCSVFPSLLLSLPHHVILTG